MKTYLHDDHLTDPQGTRILVQYNYRPGASACPTGPLVYGYDGTADEVTILGTWITSAGGRIEKFEISPFDKTRIEALLGKNPPKAD